MATFTSVPFRQHQQRMVQVRQVGGGLKLSRFWSAVKRLGGKVGKVGSKASKGGVGKARGRIGDFKAKMKDPTLRKEMMKKGAKRAGKEIFKAGVEVGGDMLIDHALGGQPMTTRDLRDISRNAGIDLVSQASSGRRINSSAVRGSLRGATQTQMRGKARSGRKPKTSLAARIRQLQERLSSANREKKALLRWGASSKRFTPAIRQFGTGIKRRKKKGGGGKKKGGKKRPKKKRSKKKKGGAKKKKKKKGGKKRPKKGLKSMNLAASAARFSKMRDVFDI
jgi:hypothetical protein